MKSLQSVFLTGGLCVAFLAGKASAAFTIWDPQGTSTNQPGNGTWENASWSTLTTYTGMAPPAHWVEGSAALFAVGSSTSTPAFTVAMNSAHTVAGVFNGLSSPAPGPCPVTIAGTGSLILPASTVQGFYAGSNAAITINVPITGAATLVAEGHGSLYLNTANTYSGGTILGYHNAPFTGSVFFGNNSAFGTGAISMTNNGTGGSLVAVGNGPYSIANAVVLTNITLTMVGTPAGVTFSGPWDTGSSGPCTMSFTGSANIVTISGVMSDTQGFTKSGAGALVLSGSNTYGSAGGTQVSSGALVLANASGSATGVSSITVVNTSAILTGSGAASGAVNNSGNLSATNLAGGPAALATGAQTWQLGSVYQWAINSATGAAGATPGWDELIANGSVIINANSSNPMMVNLISLGAGNQQGALAAFDNTQDYSWLVLHSTNPPIAGFSTAAVNLNSASFANALGAGVFSLSTNNTTNGGDLFVNFVHTPVLSVANVTVVAGSNAVLFASNSVAGSTAATAAYSWKSNNVTLSDGGRISGSSTPTLTIASAQTTDSATYTVLAANAAGSAFVPATLTVTAASTSVTWANPLPIAYGTPLDTNELNATANVPGNFVYSPAAGTVLYTGTNTLSVVFTPNDTNNYSTLTNTASVVVLPVPLTVTAANAARPVGAANPVFTGTMVGLVNNDNITAAYHCSATSNSPAGSYPIVPSLVDPNNLETNYTVSLVNGTLNVGTVVTWTNPPALPYGAALGSNQLNATANVPGNFVYSPAAGTVFASIGAYPLSAVFTPNDTTNYSIVTNPVSLVVSPAPLTVAANNATRQASTTNPIFTGTITGLVNSDNITATYSCSATPSSPAGTYPIIPALVDPGNRQTNYSVSLVNGTLTVTPPAPPITAAAPNIIPLPVTLQTNPGVFTLCPSQPATPTPGQAQIRILVDGASVPTGQYLAGALFKSTGYQFELGTNPATNAVKGAILITTSNAIGTLGAEGYELTVAPDSVVIRAPQQGGTFYGAQSLLQLLPPQIYSPVIATNVAWVAPCVYINDYPAFSWRGVMLDVARHFFNKQEVEQFVDALAMHKINTLHLHLVDDQAWRLEMTNYPNVTAIGAWRNGLDYGLNPRASTATNATGQYGGYYTQDEARQIVAYAAERHITVVPEIEMPCHSTCALASYPQFGCNNPVSVYNMDYPNINYGVDLYSLGTPGTMNFLRDALTEVMAIFPSKYIHCGGDEVVASGDKQWNTNTADVTNMAAIGITPNGTNSITKYQHWLSTNIASFLQANGRVMMGWTEVENGGIITNMALMDWESGSIAKAVPAAEAGQPVVVSYNDSCYINNYETANTNIEPPASTPAHTLSTVYGFNPIPSDLPANYQSNILGAQCSLWGENVPSYENVMYKTFPRESALAEITWTPLALQNYSSFANRLVAQERRFAQMGVNYNHETIPQIGAWGPTVSTSLTTNYWDITTNVTAAGELDVNFVYTTGADGLSISSVALLVNDAQVDIDAHAGFAGDGSTYTLYIVHLPETKPGATYTIEAVIAGSGGTASSGIVYLPNWN